MPEPSGSCGLSSLGLLTPVVFAGCSGRVSTVGAGMLLNMKRTGSTSPAQGMSLIVALSET